MAAMELGYGDMITTSWSWFWSVGDFTAYSLAALSSSDYISAGRTSANSPV